jgi:hypothetical protein
MNVFNNVILARNRQFPDDDRMIETCRSIFKSFNVNNLTVCIGWCAAQVILIGSYCVLGYQGNFPRFIEPKDSLQCSSLVPNREPDESSSHLPLLFF